VIILFLLGHFSRCGSSWLHCSYQMVLESFLCAGACVLLGGSGLKLSNMNLISCPDRSNTRYAFLCSFKLVCADV
jgi:hypothetical protein